LGKSIARRESPILTHSGSEANEGDSRGRIKIKSKEDMRKPGMPSPDRADTVAQAFSRHGSAAPINVESYAGESITGDLMTKAW
jgi:hypothetical protein